MDIHNLTTYHAGATQAYLNRKLQKLCDEILEPFGITKMQWLIIGCVHEAGPSGIRLSDLADKLGTSMPYLTNAVNTLEARNILLRKDDKRDTRSKPITVTKRYAKSVEQIENTLRDGLRQTIYAKIDPKEFQIYLKVMEDLARE